MLLFVTKTSLSFHGESEFYNHIFSCLCLVLGLGFLLELKMHKWFYIRANQLLFAVGVTTLKPVGF